MIIHGQLLIDPAKPPVRGFLRIEDARIQSIQEGDPDPGASGPVIGSPKHVVSPAFFDAHTHLPQADSVGCDGMELLDWLEQVIFPAEAWWGRGHAHQLARRAITGYLRQGTCGVAAYLSSHAQINSEVLDLLQRVPALRFIAGRAAMDRAAPDELTAEDLARTALRPPPSPVLPLPSPPHPRDRQRASANPRFAISCTEELMAEIGWIARDNPDLFVQTHLAETPAELQRVRELFPDDPHYTGVYDRFHLLGPRTLLGHCIHLSDDEWRLIVERQSVVVHCPGANTFLEAGIFDLAAAREHGARLALGTDVAAGPDVAMPRVARAMIEVAKLRRLATGDRSTPVPTPAEAWDLITRQNADALAWPNAGRIATDADADLLVLAPHETWLDEHLVGRLIYNWSPDLIHTRVFDGVAIDPKGVVPPC